MGIIWDTIVWAWNGLAEFGDYVWANLDLVAFLALAVGILLGSMQVQGHVVAAVIALAGAGGHHPIVVEADLLEQVGDQLLALGRGLGADVGQQFARGGVGRLLVALVLQEVLAGDFCEGAQSLETIGGLPDAHVHYVAFFAF